MKEFAAFVVFVILSIQFATNDFLLSSRVDSVPKTGFYKIQISPEVISYSKPDYSDIRLINSKGEEVPYILQEDHPLTSLTEGLYTDIPVTNFCQKDSSDKKSYINIRFDRPCEFSKLELKVSGPDFYKRRVTVGSIKKVNNKSTFEYLGEFELSSAKPHVWDAGKVKVDDWVIIIHNLDDSPVKVEAITVSQLNKWLVAKLQKGQSYYVKTGNANLLTPEYDLKYFSDSIPDTIASLLINNGTIAKPDKIRVLNEFNSKFVLWTVIIFLIILLGFLSIRMLNEMKNNQRA